ncbi:MAG: electron transfer flavoprotein subunit beta/FixA family protein [Haloechinothrix sp.]
MTNIVVLVKQVPDTYSERKLTESDHTLDRESADAVLDEINERAVEEALKIKEAGEGEVTVLCVGPDRSTDAIRKALSMGADKAIHVSDETLHGSDVIATAKVIAAAIGKVEGVDLVIAGNVSSDGGAGAVPAILAELLGLPQLTHAHHVHVEGTSIKVDRETPDEGITHLEASLPALVSVTEKINEPRYPSFKGIMAAKKRPVETLTVADLGVESGEVGLSNAWSSVVQASPKPPRQAGQRVEDEGDGGSKIAEYLVGQKLI